MNFSSPRGILEYMKPFNPTTECGMAAYVYLAPLPDSEPTTPVYPQARWQQILGCNSERVRKEKYHVWRLLAYALHARYGKKLTDLQFTCKNGKWECDICHFSLSHSHGVLCVAVADFPIGADVEKITMPSDSLALKILSDEELQRYHGMPKLEKAEYFTRIWTRRESLFKQVGGTGFFTTVAEGCTREETVTIGGEKYVVCIATPAPASMQLEKVLINPMEEFTDEFTKEEQQETEEKL